MYCYILPKFEKVLLKSLTAPLLQQHFNTLLKSGRQNGAGLSSSTVRACRRYLTMCLDGAIKAGFLSKNVEKQTEPAKLTKKEMVVLSKGEAITLIQQAAQIKNEYMKIVLPVLLQIALHTGMRQGELFGLQWKDLQLNEQYLSVNRSLASVVGKGFIFQAPKTNTSRRRILLMSEDAAALRTY